jgi:ribosomal protein S27AE
VVGPELYGVTDARDLYLQCTSCGRAAQAESVAFPVAHGQPVIDGSLPIPAVCSLCRAPFNAQGRLVPADQSACCPRCGQASPAASDADRVRCGSCGVGFLHPRLDRAERRALHGLERMARWGTPG